MTDHLLHATLQVERDHFWFRGLARFSDPLLARAVEGIPAPEILDCGCGTGYNMHRLSRFGRVTGLDLTRAGFPYAREYGEHRLIQGSVTALPVADASFDLVTGFDVLACLDEAGAQAALREFRRVLRPGGGLLINTAALPSLRGHLAAVANEVRRMRRPELALALLDAGFDIRRLTYTNLSLLPAMYAVRWVQRVLGLTGGQAHETDLRMPPAPVNALFSGLVRLEAAALRRMDMPAGSSLLALARAR